MLNIATIKILVNEIVEIAVRRYSLSNEETIKLRRTLLQWFVIERPGETDPEVLLEKFRNK